MRHYEKLRFDAWRTAGARYNADRRLRRRDAFANPSIALFAIVGVMLTLYEKFYGVAAHTPLSNYITFTSVALGLFVIAISLVEWGNAGAQRAQALHRNAEELNSFQRKLAAELEAGNNSLSTFGDEYHRIKERCSHNHDPIDDLLFQAQHRHGPLLRDAGLLPMSAFFAWVVRIVSFVQPIWLYGLFWLALAWALFEMPWPIANAGNAKPPEISDERN